MTRTYSSSFLVARLKGELDRLFHEALAFEEATFESGEWYPKIDVVESASAILILAEVPGIAASDLAVEVEGGIVTISGDKRPSAPPRTGRPRHHCVERGRGRFRRRVRLPSPVNSHLGRARLADGLLTVEFPKIQEQRRRALRLEVAPEEPGADDQT